MTLKEGACNDGRAHKYETQLRFALQMNPKIIISYQISETICGNNFYNLYMFKVRSFLKKSKKKYN